MWSPLCKGRSGGRRLLLLQHRDSGDTVTEDFYLFEHERFSVWPFPLPQRICSCRMPAHGHQEGSNTGFLPKDDWKKQGLCTLQCVHGFMNST